MAKIVTAVEFDIKDLLNLVMEAAKREAPKNVGGSKVEWLYAKEDNPNDSVVIGARVSFTGVGAK